MPLLNMSLVPQHYYVLLCTLLFCMGVVGVLFRRNFITIIMCIELMLNATNLLLASFAAHNNNADGQVMVFFIMVVAAAEVAVGLALMVMIYRNIKSVDMDILSQLKN